MEKSHRLHTLLWGASLATLIQHARLDGPSGYSSREVQYSIKNEDVYSQLLSTIAKQNLLVEGSKSPSETAQQEILDRPNRAFLSLNA